MKRLLIIFTLLCIANTVCAQRTYYYKCEKMVDGDGVASKIDIQTYFTFVNGNTAYESDANGNKTFSSFGYSTGHVLYNNTGFFYYRNISNGNYLFCSKYSHWERIYTGLDSYHYGYQLYWDENFYILVATDYSTINVIKKVSPNYIRNVRGGIFTYVLTRCTPTKPEDKIPELIR